MKFNNDYSFPHPVLGINDDVTGTASVTVVNDENSDPDNYIITAQYQVDNPDIHRLLAERKVEFVCELSCTGTFFRTSKSSSSSPHVMLIPKNAVRDEVEMLFLIVASDHIPRYTNTGAHPDFEGFTFDLQKGDVLAYLGDSRFIAGIAYQKLKAVSSFMEVTRGDQTDGGIIIILDNPKIQIQLPRADYDRYSAPSIVNNKDYASTFHASIVLPALIHALYQLSDPSKDGINETAWAKIIRFRLDHEDGLRGISLEDENVFKIAQHLLAMPVGRLLSDLYARATTASDE
jgi:hypothetical protein